MSEAVKQEIARWSPYRNALRWPDRERFDKMMNSASELAPSDVSPERAVQVLLLLILMQQHRRLIELGRRIVEELGVRKQVQLDLDPV